MNNPNKQKRNNKKLNLKKFQKLNKPNKRNKKQMDSSLMTSKESSKTVKINFKFFKTF